MKYREEMISILKRAKLFLLAFLFLLVIVVLLGGCVTADRTFGTSQLGNRTQARGMKVQSDVKAPLSFLQKVAIFKIADKRGRSIQYPKAASEFRATLVATIDRYENLRVIDEEITGKVWKEYASRSKLGASDTMKMRDILGVDCVITGSLREYKAYKPSLFDKRVITLIEVELAIRETRGGEILWSDILRSARLLDVGDTDLSQAKGLEWAALKESEREIANYVVGLFRMWSSSE